MENSLTSTLFRFVTFRAPELIKDLDHETTFVQITNPTASTIYQSVQNGQTLTQATTGFTGFNTVEQVKALSPAMYQLGQWLAQNQEAVTAESFQLQENVAALTDDAILSLWNNLFYQIATQKSMPVKDAVIELLIADNCARKTYEIPPTDAQIKAQATVRVVVPHELFKNETATVTAPTNPTTYTGSTTQMAALEALLSKDNADRYGKAINELKVARAQHEATAQEEFQLAQKSHAAEVNAFIKDKMANWHPEPEYSDSLPYTNDELPVFDYTAPQEMTSSQLNALSAETQYVLQSLELNNAASYKKALDNLSEQNANETNNMFKSSSFSDRVIVMGGAEMKVVDGFSTDDLLGYTLKAIPVTEDKYKIALVINTGQKNNGLVSSSFSLNDSASHDNVAIAAYPIESNTGLIFYPEGIALDGESHNLNATLQFQDGSVLLVEKTFTTLSAVTGKVSGGTPFTNYPTTGAPQPAPSAYGVKKLGIADYRRVDQTVCCYVPGEVSHIENIMAREYKERGTRNLRRSEITTTNESQKEQENLTDTTSTERNEMHQESDSVLNENRSLALAAGVNAQYSPSSKFSVAVNASANYASNTSKSISNRQAKDFATDVTHRASQKVNTKVREERITKMIEEFEETNKHGFDNRGDEAKNISGVYRWVDKVYKNQIVNYGKRMMYEFVIPEPASFHKQAVKNIPQSAVGLDLPLDPRTATLQPIANAQALTRTNYAIWAAKYNAVVEAPPSDTLSVGKAFSGSDWGSKERPTEVIIDKVDFTLPEGYYTVKGKVVITGQSVSDPRDPHNIGAQIGNIGFSDTSKALISSGLVTFDTNRLKLSKVIDELQPFEGSIPLSVYGCNFGAITTNITLELKLTKAAFEKWQVETFNAIIKAYEIKLEEYNAALADAKSRTEQQKAINPLYHRQIETTVLKKNCVSYLVGESYLGQDYVANKDNPGVFVAPTAQMDSYASVARFVEQAFEWEIMSYSFSPFYWGERAKWNDTYIYQNDDPLFRAFMQAGMARVIVTVRPGFEDAVMYYLATGKVWLGGQTPVIGDKLYLSIVDELKKIEETEEGDPWEIKVPTSLTVIQNSTVGLNAEGLPCNADCDDISLFSFSSDTKLARLKKEDE